MGKKDFGTLREENQMSEETTQPETVEDLWERIKAIRSNISQAQEDKGTLGRQAGDILGNSGDPVLVLEQIGAKNRFIRDSYEELGRIQDQIDKLQAETSQEEQGDETNEPA